MTTSRVVSGVTKGLPSRSPPIQAPGSRQGGNAHPISAGDGSSKLPAGLRRGSPQCCCCSSPKEKSLASSGSIGCPMFLRAVSMRRKNTGRPE